MTTTTTTTAEAATTDGGDQNAAQQDAKHAPSRTGRFLARLSAAHSARNTAELSAVRRWQPGKVDMRVAALMFADDEPATVAEYPV